MTKNLNENLNKLNGEFKDNFLVNEIIEFIHKTLEVIKMQRLYRKKKINQ